jgi:hypothetical protein
MGSVCMGWLIEHTPQMRVRVGLSGSKSKIQQLEQDMVGIIRSFKDSFSAIVI